MSKGPAPRGYAGGVEARSARAESPAPGNTGRDLAPAGGGIEGRDRPGGPDRYHDRERPPSFWDFAALAEFEAELIRERTRAGLAAAGLGGGGAGRPRKMTKAALRMAMAAMVDREATTEVAQRLGIARTTL